MPLGTEVDLGPGHIVLDETKLPHGKGQQPPTFAVYGNPPTFQPVSIVGPNRWMDQDTTLYADRPRPRRCCVRWGPSSPTERSTAALPHFSANFAVARSPISETAELLFCHQMVLAPPEKIKSRPIRLSGSRGYPE